MQKHFRAGIGNAGAITAGTIVCAEALNPHFGYFYTVKQRLVLRRTRHQSLELLDTHEFGRVLLINGIMQVADKNDGHYHEPMVHPAICMHPGPEAVLVIGGGDGGILREVLKYPFIKNVELAELDKEVIKFSNTYLPRIHGGAFRDPRVHVNIVDGRQFVEEHAGEFDIVIMDMTDPFGPSKLLYTKEFFKAVIRSFRNSSGIFIMHSESPITRPAAFACIQRTLRASFTLVSPLYLYIPMYATLWSITMCSPTIDCSLGNAAAIDRKLARYGIRGLEVYSGATHTAMQTSFPYIAELLRKRCRVITDSKPDFPDDFLS